MARPHRVRRRRRYRRGRTAMDDRAAEGRHHTLPVIRLRIVVADYLGAAVRPRLATKRLIRQVLTVYTGDCPLWTARHRRAAAAVSHRRGRGGSAQGQHRDVVDAGAVADEVVHHGLADDGWIVGTYCGSKRPKAVVDELVAILDQSVGVEKERRAFRHGDRPGGAADVR